MYDDKTIEELKSEADSLGITYSGNIGKAKLAEKIEEFYSNEASKDTPTIKEETTIPKSTVALNKRALLKKKGLKRRKCIISSNDKRTSNVETTAYLSAENPYYGISRRVPLDIKIELEECLINRARKDKILVHQDEVIMVNGSPVRTNNKVPTLTRKYNVQLY